MESRVCVVQVIADNISPERIMMDLTLNAWRESDGWHVMAKARRARKFPDNKLDVLGVATVARTAGTVSAAADAIDVDAFALTSGFCDIDPSVIRGALHDLVARSRHV